MIDPTDYLEFGQKFHGHKCPAMPLGLKIGSVAMNELGVEHSKAGELYCIVDIGDFHCAGCFGDGVQVITGCTFGKGNLIKSKKGKFSITLIDQKNKKGVKIVPKGEWLIKAFNSPFMEERKSGKPPQNIDETIVNPLIKKVLEMNPADQFNIKKIDNIRVDIPKHNWDKRLCEECGELTVADYAFHIHNRFLCADCAGMSSGPLEVGRGPKIIN
ncbi:MAG: FmdE family protein [Promethearchaeota archaeon]